MFTGIIEEVGVVKQIQNGVKSRVFTIDAPYIRDGLAIGDSISTNGVCLTAAKLQGRSFTADVMNETLQRTTLGSLKVGSKVNLERAMQMNGRFGGHIVTGHIDGTGKIIDIKKEDNAVWYTITAQPSILRYVIEKGSIAIDGISLTVASITNNQFRVSIIPHTAKQTILSEKVIGDLVNLENDMIGKYIEHFVTESNISEIASLKRCSHQEKEKKQTMITTEFLSKNGYW